MTGDTEGVATTTVSLKPYPCTCTKRMDRGPHNRKPRSVFLFLGDLRQEKGRGMLELNQRPIAADCSTTANARVAHRPGKKRSVTVDRTRDLLIFSQLSYETNWETSSGRKRHCVRVVKELVLKANGLCPREFESRRCRRFFVWGSADGPIKKRAS